MSTDIIAPIVVRLTRDDILRAKSAAVLEAIALARLRDAGVPVRGVLRFTGIDCGTLTRNDDFETGDIVFVWQEAPSAQTR